jgi:hypothetical protein
MAQIDPALQVLSNTTFSSDPALDVFKEEEEDVIDPALKNILSDVEITDEPVPIISEEDANSFGNIFGKAFDRTQLGIYEGIKLFAEEAQEKFPETSSKVIDLANKGIEKNQQDLAERASTQDVKQFTEYFPQFKEQLNQGDYKNAFLDFYNNLKDTTADTLGSVAPAIMTGVATTVPGRLLLRLGPKATSVLGALSFTLPASLPIKSSTYKEAKKIGEDIGIETEEEDARKYSTYAFGMSAALNSLVPLIALKPFIGSFGKEATVKFVKKEVTDELKKEMSEKSAIKLGKEIADDVVKKASKEMNKEVIEKAVAPSLIKTGLKRGTVTGVTEAVTEAAQERTQIAAAGLASPLQTTSPYEQEEINKRLINAGVAGFLGGKAIGNFAGAIEAINLKGVASEANDLIKSKTDMEKLTEKDELNNDLQNIIRGTYSGKPKVFNAVDMMFRRSITPLEEFSTRSKSNKKVFDSFNNAYQNISQRAGQEGVKIMDALRPISKSIKVPFTSTISKKVNDNVYEILNNYYPNKKYSKRDLATAKEVRKILGEKIKPEIEFTSDQLKSYILDPEFIQEIPEIEQARAEQRINEEDANKISEDISKLRIKYARLLNNAKTEQERGQIETDLETDKKFNKIVDTTIAPAVTTGIFNNLKQAGLKLDFEDDYVEAVYKLGGIGSGRRKKFAKILQESQPESFNAHTAHEAIENILGNNGFYVPSDKILRLENIFENRTATDFDKSFQKPRKINKKTRQKLYEAGLVETNLNKLLNKYILDSSTRIEIGKIAKTFNEEVASERGTRTITQDEFNHLKDIFQGLQNNHSPIRGSFKKFQRKFLTYQYMVTLTLSALTSLTEPLILLSRVRPTDVFFGLTQSALNTLRQGMRAVFPKIPLSERERAFRGIVEGLDGTIAERMSNIAGVDVVKNVTDKYFRAIGLTQVTQFSRDMGYQAGIRQLKDDIVDLLREKRSGKKLTKGGIRAQKRLLEVGLTEQIINQQDVKDFVEGKIKQPPPIIQKAMSRFVNEIIMAPNVINRPLWMSNPHLAMVAQLKGFMFVFGNTIFMKIWRDIFKPMVTAKRLPVDQAVKYALAFGIIMAGTMGIREIKDFIRYNGDGPYQNLSTFQKIIEAFINSNILGPGTVLYESLLSFKYGAKPLETIAGPGLSWLSNALSAIGQAGMGNVRTLSRFLINNIPILSAVLPREKKDIGTDILERKLEDLLQ